MTIRQTWNRMGSTDKIMALGAGLYGVSPIDLLPLNPIDDLIVVGLVAAYLFVTGKWKPGDLLRRG